MMTLELISSDFFLRGQIKTVILLRYKQYRFDKAWLRQAFSGGVFF